MSTSDLRFRPASKLDTLALAQWIDAFENLLKAEGSQKPTNTSAPFPARTRWIVLRDALRIGCIDQGEHRLRIFLKPSAWTLTSVSEVAEAFREFQNEKAKGVRA